MKLQCSVVGFLLCVVLIGTRSVSAQESFEPTVNSRRDAISKGRVKEFHAAMEAIGSEAEKRERWAEASSAYGEAAYSAISMGQLQRAITLGTKAVGLAQKAKDPRLQAQTMSFLALAYAHVGQPENEREWLLKAVDALKAFQGNKEIQEARLYRMLGVNYLRQREHKKAIEHAAYSIQVLEASFIGRRLNPQAMAERQSQIVNGLNVLGKAHLEAGNYKEAINAFERGLTLHQTARLINPTDQLMGLGRAYLGQKDFPRAMENLTKALQIAEGRRQYVTIQAASTALGDVFLQTEKPSEAITYYKKAIDSIESTRSLLESEELRTSFIEDKGQTYAGIIQANIEAKNFDEAFNYSERARSRAFLDILGNKVQLARSGTMLEHERALQARISVLKAMAEGPEADASGTAELRKDLADAERDYNDYVSKIRKENKEQASLMNVEPLTLKQVQERLDPGVTLLEYFVARGTVWLWLVEKDRVEFVSTTIPRSDLVSKVTSLRDSIYQFAEKERFSALSQELYRLLIEPALPHIKGKELIIVPHDVLHYLPFQTLLGSDNRYLIEKYPIYYLSSASLMQFTQEKRKARGELTTVLAQAGKILALGNPDLNDAKMALQFAEIEAKQIKSLYPESTVYLNKDASEARAKELSPQSDIVHFASHAELSEDDPLASAILLAKSDKEDGRLEVREIFGMDLKASLVVLSACETGLGKLSSGDELVGLTRAFIYAGTPSVVASLWNVEDSSTAQLMASFYKNLKTMTKVEALRQAQLQLIKGSVNSELLARRGIGGVGKLGEAAKVKTPSVETVSSATSVSNSISTSHPYFWAPFILVGEGK